ncbi:MAG TPA: hypothetical protein DCQ77_08795, partial [Betaproteobacteria bacterium]|nr:hypothetical protein [Betaproteobacteria bacterium]
MLLALLPATLLALSLGYFFTISRITDLDQALRNRGIAIARHLAPASEYGVFSGNREILQHLADSVHNDPDVIAVAITDRKGNILARYGKVDNLFLVSAQTSVPNSDANAERVTVSQRNNNLVFRIPIIQTEVQVDDFVSDFPATTAESVAPAS